MPCAVAAATTSLRRSGANSNTPTASLPQRPFSTGSSIAPGHTAVRQAILTDMRDVG
jgi:hypothetical protein